MKAECRYCLDPIRTYGGRGLCQECYKTPGVREKFPVKRDTGRRGTGNGCVNAPRPIVPTSAAPGSEEKIAILAERARSRQGLWHPEDV